jgi:hypothetical protein
MQQYDFAEKVRVVNALCANEGQYGYGPLSSYLRREGVPRSTAYAWKKRFAWLVLCGSMAISRLERKVGELQAENGTLRRGCERRQAADRDREHRFILEAAVKANSESDIASLMGVAFGEGRSHQTVHRHIQEAGAKARAAFEQFFEGKGKEGAADEIFLGESPLLLMVHPRSLGITGLRLAQGRTGQDWQPVLAAMEELECITSDEARGLGKGAREAGKRRSSDMFHLLRGGAAELARQERACYAKMAEEYEALSKKDRAERQGKLREMDRARSEYKRAQRACDQALGEHDRLAGLFEKVRHAFEHVDDEGQVNTPFRARRMVNEALDAMASTPEGQRLCAKLKGVKGVATFVFLEVLQEGLSAFGLEQIGPDREQRLGRLVRHILKWRCQHKDAHMEPDPELGAAELQQRVLACVDRAVRASSSVECVNARIRVAQVVKKHFGEDFVYLLAVHHNMTPFGRGSVRVGKSPAELLALELPTNDWIELLDMMPMPEAA